MLLVVVKDKKGCIKFCLSNDTPLSSLLEYLNLD